METIQKKNHNNEVKALYKNVFKNVQHKNI